MYESNYARDCVSSVNLSLVSYRENRELANNVAAVILPSKLADTLISAGLSSSSAGYISSNCSVVASTADAAFHSETELNAVLLRLNGTDQYVLSISGVNYGDGALN